MDATTTFPQISAEPQSRARRSLNGPLRLVAVAALVSAFGCGAESGTPGTQVPAYGAPGAGAANEIPATKDDGAEEAANPSDGVERTDEGGTNGPLDLAGGEEGPAVGGGTGGAPTVVEVTDPVPPGNVGNTFPVEDTGADCDVSAGGLQQNPNLPDPFAMNDGTRISSIADWRCRRAEIKKDVEEFEIGPKPAPPTVQASLNGNTLSVNVTTAAGSITLTSNVSSPAGAGPHCVAIGMNGDSSLINGCVEVPFMHNQVVTYAQNSNQSQQDPFYRVYPELFGRIGNYAAWSWGISRLIDGLEQVKDQLNVDTTKIGVHGCSYAGKMALFGGALDERVALTVAQESGGGGINSWRTSQAFTTRTGTQIEKIDNTNYAWFKTSMRNLDQNSLPHDHHEVIAMIAPRAVVALGNPPYEWLGDESGYKSIMAAREVWTAMGVADRIGFDFASGHEHCTATAGQANTVNTFVNRFLEAQDANTNITLAPAQTQFDLNYSSVINWETPTLQ